MPPWWKNCCFASPELLHDSLEGEGLRTLRLGLLAWLFL